jgi:hypothetical protein
MRVITSTAHTPFGGINYVISELDKKGIGALLTSSLPELNPQSRYSWRDIFYSYWSVFLCGGDCAEDLGGNFKKALGQSPYISIPSPDRVLNRFKELAEEPSLFISKRNSTTHEVALNDRLNRLNIGICCKLFNYSNTRVTLDYDNTLCFTDKKDASRTYKGDSGYQPGVALIDSQVVYVENRSGRSTAHVGQAETLRRMFCHLKQKGIVANKFRADSASYGLDMIRTIEEFTDNFYVRARMSQTLEKAISKITNWEKVVHENGEFYRGEILFTPFQRVVRDTRKANELKSYRLIVTKEKRRDGQVNFFTKEACIYSAIMTNDIEMSASQIVHFYNQRGKAEREFDIMKNDFGWNKLPFSYLAQNNVYLLVTAMCRNIYAYLIQLYSRKVAGLEPHYRLKKFIFRFICIPAKWIRQSRQWKLKVYGSIAFRT